MSASTKEQLSSGAIAYGPSIFERFEVAAAVFPDKLAVVDDRSRVTYAELRSRAIAVAEALRQFPDATAIGILLPHSAAFWTAILGCLAAGRPYLALDIVHPVRRNARIVSGADLSTVITTADCDPDGAVLPASVTRIDLAALPAPAALRAPFSGRRDLCAPASILYTSGSTGEPKGIVNSEENLLARVLTYVKEGGLGAEDRFLTLSSPCTIAGTREGLTSLLLGATLFICDLHRHGLGQVQRVIASEGVTVLNAVPSVLRALMPRTGGANPALHSLRLIRVGGEMVFWNDVEQFRRATRPGCKIVVGFSSTEETGAHWVVPIATVVTGAGVPVGYALPDNDFSIIDENGEPLPPGEVGELVVRSRHVALGYFRNGRCERGDIEQDPLDPAVRITRTGDLMRIRPDGLCEACGRKDRQTKINGQRVEPGEVEAALRACAEVVDAAAIVRRDGRTVWLEAFVVLGAAEPDSALGQVQASIRAALPVYMYPTRLHLLPELPRAASHKIDTTALTRLAEQAEEQRARAATALRDAREASRNQRVVHRLWRSVLGRRAALEGMSFEACGGDSLNFLEFVLLLEKALGRRLPFETFSRLMEPRQIVAALERNAGPMVVETARPTVFLLPGLYGDDLRVATLRLALESRIRFVLIEYPDWPDMAAAESAGEAVIAAATDQILAAAPPGPIALLGYSYGGRVAEKVARRLLQMGRSVGLIGIIDTDLSFRRRRAPQRLALKLRHFRQEIAGSFAFGSFAGVAGFAAARLAHDLIGLQNARRTASVWRPLLPDRSVLVLDRWLQMVLRLAAAAEWVARPDPAPLPVPTILFRSDDHEPDAPDDLGWSRRCPRLEILRLGGDHETMLDRPHRDPLCERLVAALQQAGPAASGMTATAA